MTDRQKILIVDDRKENLFTLRQVLNEVDAEIVEATTGNEALAATLNHEFALAILDVQMPGMSGYELAGHIRGDKKTLMMPIVFLTAAYADEEHKFMGYEAGGVDYLTKPYSPEVMRAKVNVFLEIDRYRRELEMHRDHLETLVAERTTQLNERVKELKSLYAISSLVAEPYESIDETLKVAVNLIPPGLQYPEITGARIVFDGREFVSANFRDTGWKQSADIVIAGKTVGTVEVCYLEERPALDDGPFLKEERDLIIDIARQLGVMIGRKQADENFTRLNKQHELILNSVAEGILGLDLEGNHVFVNLAAAGMLGYEAEELLGRPSHSIWHPLRPDGSPFPEEECVIQSSCRKGEVHRVYDDVFWRKDGISFSVEYACTPIYERDRLTGTVLTFADITESKKRKEELRESEESYRNLFENASEAIFVAQDGKIVFLNPKTTMMIGYSAEELMVRPFIEFIHPDDRNMVIDRHIRRIKGEEFPHIYDFRIIQRNDNIKWAELNAVAIQWKKKAATLNFLTDITDRKQAEEELLTSFEKLRKAMDGIIQAMALTVENRDPYTAGHQRRVADLARSIAQGMGLSEDQVDGLRMAGIVHDLGKIAVPAEILSKPSKLSNLEFGLIKVHPQISYDILKDIDFPWPLAEIVFQHHERMDGSGYPEGLSGTNILLEARILAVADVVEAISSHRPYRPGLGIDAALEEIEKNRGILFDAEAVEVCLKLFREKGYIFN